MSDDAFARLIAPVTSEAFFATIFERDIVHVARGDAAYFADLYDVGCIEEALVLGARAPEHFALIKHGAPEISGDDLTGERNAPPGRPARTASRFAELDPRTVLAKFAAGYTLTIQDAGAFHPALAQFCNRIQARLGFFAQANAYFTPPNAQGFAIHYDTHDTLIAQIEGSKDWTIYEPVVPLPLDLQPFSAARHDGALGTPRTVRLDAGDSLYVPRGYPHHATSAERRSLHLTFALSPTRVVDLLEALVRLAALGEVEFRRGLPPGWHRDPAFAAAFSARLASLLPRAIVPERIAPAAELAFNDVFAATRAVTHGAFDALAATNDLAPSTIVTLRNDAPFHIRDRGERLDIVLATKVIAVSGATRAAFARLAERPATYAELAATLPADTAAGFVYTLVIEGILTVTAP